MKHIVIYHANCADGYTAGCITFKWLQDNITDHAICDETVEMHAGVYGEAPPDVAGHKVYIVDFSYPRPIMEQIIRDCAMLTWLDHHATAIKESGDLMEQWRHKVTGKLDIGRSGAWLAWEWFHGRAAVPTMVKLVDDRDRWVFKYPHSRPFAAGLFSKEYRREIWDWAMTEEGTAELTQRGQAIDEYNLKTIKELVEDCARVVMWPVTDINWPPCKCVVANLPYTMASDGGQMMLAQYPEAEFAVIWYRAANKYVYSLRSRANGVNVGALAKAMGGGGHHSASGFKTDTPLDL